MPTEKRKLGDICEKLAVRLLVARGYKILERNYLKKWGEIDLIALEPSVSRETPQLHFIEVKGQTVKFTYLQKHRPEDNVHLWKTRRLWRAIQTWFMEHSEYEDYEWQIDIAAVFLDLEARKARIRWTKNVIIEQ